MSTTTELVVLSLKPGSNIGDPADDAAKVLKQTCETLSETPGCQQIHFGTVIEDNSKLRLLIDWDSLEKHKEFMASDRYAAFLNNIKTIISAPPSIVHVDFQPTKAHDEVLSAPVTEIATFYFDGAAPEDYGQGIDKLKASAYKVDGSRGITWGSSHETVEHEGVKGKAVVAALGWTSVDAHMAFRETPLFKDLVPHLRSTSKGAAVQHIQAMKYLD